MNSNNHKKEHVSKIEIFFRVLLAISIPSYCIYGFINDGIYLPIKTAEESLTFRTESGILLIIVSLIISFSLIYNLVLPTKIKASERFLIAIRIGKYIAWALFLVAIIWQLQINSA